MLVNKENGVAASSRNPSSIITPHFYYVAALEWSLNTHLTRL
jgi:hypothetical protein